MPIQPSDPSCQASSIQVSIISGKVGSLPPASRGLHHCMSPLSHKASTVRRVSVRRSSDSADSSAVTARSVRAASGPSRVSRRACVWPTGRGSQLHRTTSPSVRAGRPAVRR